MNLSSQIKTQGSFEHVLAVVSEALKAQGFGILTQIDFHKKIQEKLNKKIPTTVILGACHPGLAFEAYSINSAVVNLMPCNVVIQEKSAGEWSVEFALAEPILAILKDEKLQILAKTVDEKIKLAAKAVESRL